MSIQVSVQCDECKEYWEDFECHKFICDQCKEKVNCNYIKLCFSDLMDEIEKWKLVEIHGNIVGFETEKEKEQFLRGCKYGMEKCIYRVADFFQRLDDDDVSGFDEILIRKFEEMQSKFKKQKVNPILIGPDV